MGVGSRREGCSDRTRGLSPVIGFVLLIGIVAIASLGILVAGSDLLTEYQQQSELDRVEQAFVELSLEMEHVAKHGDTSKTMNLESGEHGAVVRAETGWIKIESNDLGAPINRTFGTIEYEADDGTKIAYEAGGVFRETGNETRVISTPPIHYNTQDHTFTFPITTISGDERLGSGNIDLEHNNTVIFPEATVVSNSSVTVTVKSEYYRGWERYFEQQAGAPVIRDVNHEEQTITARLGHIELEEAFSSGLIYSDTFGANGFDSDGLHPKPEYGSLPEMDRVINEMIADIGNGSYSEPVTEYEEINGTGDQDTLESGTYFTKDVTLQSDLTFNLTSGNATLVVDGSITANDAGFTVENWVNESGVNHTLKVYLTGDFYVHKQNISVRSDSGESNSQQLQLYGTSDTSIGIHGGSYEGIIYAPSDDFDGPNAVLTKGKCNDHQACLISNPKFTGAMIVSSAHFQANAINIQYDYNLEDAAIDPHPAGYSVPPQLTYLNVAHHEVRVTNK